MAGEISRVEVEIFGERYVFKGDASPEHIRRLAEDVDRRVRDIVNRHSRIPTTKAAILVAVNLADELNRLQDSYDSLVRMIEVEKVK
jgi:cell division protein ZapA